MSSFNQKRIIVTGAGSGIGRELVKQLIPFTQNLLAVDVSEKKLSSLQSEYSELRSVLVVDLSLPSGNGLILDWVSSNWGHADFCFANAGKAHFSQAEKQNGQELQDLIQLNLTSPIDLGLGLLKLSKDHPFRHVVTASAMSFWSLPGYSSYAATKAGLRYWAEAVWAEKGKDWLSLGFPIATQTGFFDSAGKEIPKAFPVQSPAHVAKSLIQGASKGNRKIYPSELFHWIVIMNRLIPVIKPIYVWIEYLKYSKWLRKHSDS